MFRQPVRNIGRGPIILIDLAIILRQRRLHRGQILVAIIAQARPERKPPRLRAPIGHDALRAEDQPVLRAGGAGDAAAGGRGHTAQQLAGDRIAHAIEARRHGDHRIGQPAAKAAQRVIDHDIERSAVIGRIFERAIIADMPITPADMRLEMHPAARLPDDPAIPHQAAGLIGDRARRIGVGLQLPARRIDQRARRIAQRIAAGNLDILKADPAHQRHIAHQRNDDLGAAMVFARTLVQKRAIFLHKARFRAQAHRQAIARLVAHRHRRILRCRMVKAKRRAGQRADAGRGVLMLLGIGDMVMRRELDIIHMRRQRRPDKAGIDMGPLAIRGRHGGRRGARARDVAVHRHGAIIEPQRRCAKRGLPAHNPR